MIFGATTFGTPPIGGIQFGQLRSVAVVGIVFCSSFTIAPSFAASAVDPVDQFADFWLSTRRATQNKTMGNWNTLQPVSVVGNQIGSFIKVPSI